MADYKVVDGDGTVKTLGTDGSGEPTLQIDLDDSDLGGDAGDDGLATKQFKLGEVF